MIDERRATRTLHDLLLSIASSGECSQFSHSTYIPLFEHNFRWCIDSVVPERILSISRTRTVSNKASSAIGFCLKSLSIEGHSWKIVRIWLCIKEMRKLVIVNEKFFFISFFLYSFSSSVTVQETKRSILLLVKIFLPYMCN